MASELEDDVGRIDADPDPGQEDRDEEPGVEHLLEHHRVLEQGVVRPAVLDERPLEELDLGLGDVERLAGDEGLQGEEIDDQHQDRAIR